MNANKNNNDKNKKKKKDWNKNEENMNKNKENTADIHRRNNINRVSDLAERLRQVGKIITQLLKELRDRRLKVILVIIWQNVVIKWATVFPIVEAQ